MTNSPQDFLVRIMPTGMVLPLATKFDLVTQIYMQKLSMISPSMEMSVYLEEERLLEREWDNPVGIHRLCPLIL